MSPIQHNNKKIAFTTQLGILRFRMIFLTCSFIFSCLPPLQMQLQATQCFSQPGTHSMTMELMSSLHPAGTRVMRAFVVMLGEHHPASCVKIEHIWSCTEHNTW
jgi:hypothetical protein